MIFFLTVYYMNKLIRKALKSTALLYFILFLAIVNIVGYLSMGQFDAVVVFAIIGFIAQSFSKNMIMILTIPLFLTAFYVTLFNNNNHEGFKGFNKLKKNIKKDVSKHNIKNELKLHCHKLTENDCTEPCKWNKETNKCHSTHHKKNKEQLAQLHPQWIKDEDKTEEEFYKSVDDLSLIHI